MRNVFVRTPYNYDVEAVSRETGILEEMESMTNQSFKEECDINTIVRRFGVTGQVPAGIRVPTYQMFEDIFDFHSAMNTIAEARESFDQLPATVRRRFENDPQKFVAFCADPKNLPEMRKMGLAIPEAEPQNTSEPNVSAKGKANGSASVKAGVGEPAAPKGGSAGSGDGDEGGA